MKIYPRHAKLTAARGWTFSKVMNRAADRKMLDNQSFVAQYLALALFTVGVANSLGSDDLLAAFAAGELSASINAFSLLMWFSVQVVQYPGMVVSTQQQRTKSSRMLSTSCSTARASSISAPGPLFNFTTLPR